MAKWNYYVENLTLKALQDVDQLNTLGEMGWELIILKRLAGQQEKWVAVFKKQVQ